MARLSAVKVLIVAWAALALVSAAHAAPSPNSSRRPQLQRKATEIEVSEAQFRALDRRQGNWTGYVRGLGEVHLVLTIFDKAGAKIRRYMGSVNLVPKDPRIKFNYITALPKISGWSWKVTAYTS